MFGLTQGLAVSSKDSHDLYIIRFLYINKALMYLQAQVICFRTQSQLVCSFQSQGVSKILGGIILLKGTQVEFNCPIECHTFLKSP